MSDCKNYEKNLEGCTCSYTSCGDRGVCCDCVRKHRNNGEIPGCFFTTLGEKTYDRSIENFIRTYENRG